MFALLSGRLGSLIADERSVSSRVFKRSGSGGHDLRTQPQKGAAALDAKFRQVYSVPLNDKNLLKLFWQLTRS
jgi:hypothetical protein